MNILITGSKGFVGSNLLEVLPKKYRIYEFNRSDSLDKLKDLNDIDIIFHFAGEVNPKLNDEQILDGNIKLAKIFSEKLRKIRQSKLLIFTSSIHAQKQKNSYGKSKYQAEKLLEQLAFDTSHKIIIYRLPHLFGEKCRPNHNSVITTWINNCIDGQKLTIYDRKMEINYVYIKDLMNDFLKDLNKNIDNEFLIYKRPSIIYKTTLGYVADKICEFKEILLKNEKIKTTNKFEEKLFKTFEYYFNQKITYE